MYILGIDGGGTKTVCLVMDNNANIISRGESGAANYHSVGENLAFSSIQEAIQQAVMPLGKIEVQAIGLGLAGISRPRDFKIVQAWIDQLQENDSIDLCWRSPGNMVIHHDAFIALVGGTGRTDGIVVNAGTGSIVFGRNRHGITKRVGGWGYLLGDGASGYGIALKGMEAALKANDGLYSPTCLVDDFCLHLGLNSIGDLVEVIYRQGWGVTQIAALAPVVDAAATKGDKIAQGIMKEAVKELVISTQVVGQALFLEGKVIEVVTTGSVWQSVYPFRQQFEFSLSNLLPNVKVIFPRHEPAYGAACLALQTLSKK